MTASSVPPAASGSAWVPFRSRVFTIVWLATLVANIGTWMRDVGAGWLMTSLSASATAVALVQVATTLPIFLLSLPAGALADIVDRRRVLIAVNIGLALVALALGLATRSGVMTPAGLIAGLLLAGVGTALMQPLSQSLTVMTVPRSDLRAAVALNSLGLNVSRAIGPALGGALIAAVGVAFNFFVDALSYLAVVAALWWWKGASARPSSDPPERLASAMLAGLRFAWHAPALRTTIVRAGSFFAFASAYWSLLPLIARNELGGGPGYYGALLACVGAGAVAGAVALPALRRHLGAEATVRGGIVVSVVVLAVLGTVRDQVVAAVAMALAGAAWIAVLTTANVTAQTHLPNWVRGRGLAIYLTVFYGAMTLGSLLWGWLADLQSIRVALWSAAALGVAAFVFALVKPLPDDEPDLTPSLHWPEPALAQGIDGDRGPVLVTVEYQVAPGQAAAFVAALRDFSAQRLRDGAFQWGVYEDLARPGRMLETFLVPSWEEHQRQHHRVSRHDAELQAGLLRFQLDGQPPRVAHLATPSG